jgi:hypothetical protein
MYKYQETLRAFNGNIPDHEWTTISTHRTLKGAVRAYEKGRRNMRKRVSNSYSWDCNQRVIDSAGNTVDYRDLWYLE